MAIEIKEFVGEGNIKNTKEQAANKKSKNDKAGKNIKNVTKKKAKNS